MSDNLLRLDILKAGLVVLKKQVQTRKEDLLARIHRGGELSPEEERWLDDEANHVDEEMVVGILEEASNYDHGLSQLNLHQRDLVEKLREAAVRAILPGNAKKRKRKEMTNAEPGLTQSVQRQEAQVKRTTIATLSQRIEVLDWYHQSSGKNQSKTSKHFAARYPTMKINQPLLSKWLHDETKWRIQYAEEESKGRADKVKRVRQTEHPAVNKALELWVAKAMNDNLIITGDVLRAQWTKFANLAAVPDDERLKLSDGWLTSFKDRCGLKQWKAHGEAGSVDMETVKQECARIQEVISQHGYALRDIFNMDETGLFYGMPPDRGLMDAPKSGVKGNKKRLTLVFTANAAGTEKLPAIIIGKARRPRDFIGQIGLEHRFYYRHNAKAWMITELYQEWLTDWDTKLRRTNRHILLLQDNFSAHKPPQDLTNIRVQNFAANMTAHVQPNDAGIIRCFKAHYRKSFIHRAIDLYEQGTHASKIYEIKQLEAMELAKQAWSDVDTTTIRNCWVKTGILPDSLLEPTASPVSARPTIPISSLLSSDTASIPNDLGNDTLLSVESEVNDGLDELERFGILRRRDRMGLEELLNPAPESILIDRTVSDEEIFESVQVAEDRGSDGADSDDGKDDKLRPKRSRRDALEAVATLRDCLANRHDEFADKGRVWLANFGRQTRQEQAQAMKPSLITDYFSCL